MSHLEIERKFFIAPDDQRWRAAVQRQSRFRQGYLANNERCSVRVRVDGQQGWFSVKAMTPGPARAEYEYPLPLGDADQIIETLCSRPLIEKTRYFVLHGAHLWEIDEFAGDNAGLIVAEVELQREDEAVELPDWAAMEVTEDIRFYNFRLTGQPWSQWGAEWMSAEFRRRTP